jgi:hypothetical protein
MTALRIAQGIAGKMRVPFAVIDTEARSASKYADRIPFDVDDLDKKTVDHYIASMNAARDAGYKVLVVDSLSHAWRELTDEVDRIAQASTSKNTFSPWAKVNPKQKRFIDAILNYPGHIIATMRSTTEWVIGEGKGGKLAPEKVGLKPEQGKGIEFEFDLLVELDQKHQATITKDRTGKYQDETIDKPGEEFGIALYDWLASGTAAPPSAAAELKAAPVTAKPAAAKNNHAEPGIKAEKTNPLKVRGEGLIQDIGQIMTAVSPQGPAYFSEEEKEEARQVIRSIKLDDTGIGELEEFKAYLGEELQKRQVKKGDTKAA